MSTETTAIDLHPYRTALRRYGLASIATHLHPTDSTAIEQEAAARALVELIVADARKQSAGEIAIAIEALDDHGYGMYAAAHREAAAAARSWATTNIQEG